MRDRGPAILDQINDLLAQATGLRRFRNTTALNANIMSYSDPLNAPGNRVMAGPHEYQILDAGAVGEHLRSLSGLKLALTPENNLVAPISAFGAKDDGAEDFDNAPVFTRAAAWLAGRGGGKLVIDSQAAGIGYYLNSNVVIPGGVHVECHCPLIYGPGARMAIQGALQEDDKLYLIRATSGAGTDHPNRLYLSNAADGNAAQFAVGDLVVVRGENDASGVASDRDLAFVAEVVTGGGGDLGSNYIVLDRDLQFAYEPDYPDSQSPAEVDYTTIAKRVMSRMTTDHAAGASTISVVNASTFALGDFVLVQDFETIERITGPSANDRNLEGAQVLARDLVANTITLSAPLAHSYTTAFNGIVGKMTPVMGARITGARVRFAAPQAGANRWVFWMAYAVNSGCVDCAIITRPGEVDGEGAFIGQLAQGFRVGEGCIGCYVDRAHVEQPAYSGGGDGYGVALYDGARFCSVTNSYFDGTRHAVLEFKGACNNLIGGNISANCLNSDFDAHGGGELGSVYIGNVARWGPEKAADVDVKAAFRVGNPVHLAGGSKILFLGNRAEGFPSEDQAFDIQAPCSHVSIIANHALNCGVFARIRYNNRGDAGDAPTQAKMQALAISDILLSGNHFVGPGSERFLDVDGGPLRAVSRVSSLGNIINGVTNARQQYYVRRADRVTLLDDASLHTLPGAANTLMWFDDVTNLVALRQTIIGADRAVRAVNCPGAVFDGFTLKDLASGHVLVDAGGNAGLRFTDYKAIGFAPTTLDTAVSAGRVIRRALLDDSAAGARASLGAQEATPFLAGLAALAVTNNRYPYVDFAGNWQLGTTTTFGRSLMSASDAAAGRTALGLATNPALWMTYGGTANAIALTSGAGITGTPPTGLMLRFRATAANSGAATIALDGGAAIACRTISGAVLPAGYIRTDTETRAHFDGTFWVLERQAEVLTNANGRYQRLADGTQECAHSVNLPYSSSNTCQADWTFPAAFASSVVTVVMTLKSRAAATPFPGELAAPRADPVTATQATLRQPNIVGMTAFAPGDVVAMHAFATGTWY